MWLNRWCSAFAVPIVALLAFGIRLLHAAFLSRTPFFEGQVIDAATYRAFAEQIARTGDFGGAFYQPPLYPAFLAVLFWTGLSSTWAISIAQAALGATTAALMVPLGAALSSDPAQARKVGLWSGLAAAFYGPLILFDLELLPPSVVHPLLMGAFVLALRRAKAGIGDALLGLFLGLAVTGWSLVAVLVPGFLLLRAWRTPRPSWRAVFIALPFLLLPAALTARHNAAHDGAGVVVSYNSGINLWLGNNPRWRDTWRARPGAQFEPELERPDREGVTRPGERSAYFRRLVLRDAAARPLAAVSRTLEKFYYVWHGREIRRNQDIALLREASPVLRVLVWEAGLHFPFGLVAPLALVALWRRRHEPDLRVIAASVFGYALALAAFFVAARYRLPMALILLPLAIDQVLRFVELGRAGARPAAAALVSCVGLNFSIPFTATFTAGPAERGILEAHAWRNQGKLEEAERIGATLVQDFPRDANAQMLRAELLTARGDCRAASEPLRRTIELAPRAATPRVMLGTCLEELGDSSAAERAYAGALSLHPYHAMALKRAGAMYARHGRVLEAHALFSRFVKSGYADPEVERWLAELEPARRRVTGAGR